ncbi:MAG: hypothetical protein LUC97_09140 [Clostridiales bacterium]|nr:hypothetical protein [Clostridiales bacterium]
MKRPMPVFLAFLILGIIWGSLSLSPLGVIPEGFLLKNGTYEDIIPHYITL